MFDQHSFNSCSKDLDGLARERSRLDQIGVNMGGKLVCRTNAHCMASTLAHLQVVDELLKQLTGHLQSSKMHTMPCLD